MGENRVKERARGERRREIDIRDDSERIGE